MRHLQTSAQLRYAIIGFIVLPQINSFEQHGYKSDDSIFFFGRQFRAVEWWSIQKTIDCWSKNGSWVFMNNTIIDEISLYRACWRFISYGPRNPCSMILDFDALKYEWMCNCSNPLLHFSAEMFCQVMTNRGDVVIVGDSVNKQLHTSLKESFLLNSKSQCTSLTDIDVFSCPNNNSVTVAFYRNDLLSLITANESFTKHAYEQIWISKLTNPKSLLILNRGAHFENDSKLIKDINVTFSFLRKHYPNVSIIWRNTPPGVNLHNGVFSVPLQSTPKVPHRYHWDEFQRQNEIVRILLETYYPETLVIDVVSPSILRQDAHYDEIHYCIPGPVSLWVDLILSALHLVSTFSSQN